MSETNKKEKTNFTFKRGEVLVLPSITLAKMKTGESRFFESKGDIKTVEDVDPKTEKPKIDPETEKPMMINTLHVIDLETGEEGEIVLGFMVVKALKNVESLAGTKFEMVKGEKKGRTFLWTVYMEA